MTVLFSEGIFVCNDVPADESHMNFKKFWNSQ
jgi:hypothetical protein